MEASGNADQVRERAYGCLNDGHTDWPSVKEAIKKYNRSSLESRFASAFCSRARELDEGMAIDVEGVYNEARRKAESNCGIASAYHETMSPGPGTPDKNREKTYDEKIKVLEKIEKVVADIVNGAVLRLGVPPTELDQIKQLVGDIDGEDGGTCGVA